ncbi:S9 family peptidase [Marinicauda salina]|uniref:Acyl-peptide hydrolase n=1 Tax=Marinicauda salina TaxID=2135793 RepID=A0A2U2BTL7_9PROT|nr:S9 family peptidase [Marinicauda salina]PWE17345.1 S9 family peptidase [Marinicauda salina]
MNRARIFAAAALGFAVACSPSGEEAADGAAPRTGDDAVQTYDAAAFFETTSYVMASSNGHGFRAADGTLLISSDETGVYNAYALDPATGEQTALTGSEDDATFAVSWFPDDGRALVSADEGGDELTHIYARETHGTLEDLTPGEEVKANFMGWAEDGEAFWIATNERDAAAFDLYAYDADDYERALVFENVDAYQLSDISPDGRWLALTRPRTSADSNIFLVDLEAEAAEPELITEHEGDIAYGVYDFTADSETLVYATNEHGEFNQAWTRDLETGETAPLIEADWDVMYVSDSPSGRYRVSAINADARTEVTIVDTETGGEVLLPPLPEGDLGQVRFDRDEQRIAFTIDAATSPANIHIVDLESGDHARLTDALNPAIDETDLVPAQVVRFESFDGLEIPGVLYRPHGATADAPVPAMVWVHGGPGGQSRVGYSPTIQHMVNHGYAVYAVNNRGSSGYGKTFFHMDDRRHGEEDLGDVVAAGDWLRSLDWVQDDAVGVIGGSYGGYLTAAALAFRPEAFDAGIDIFGVTNWVRTLQSIPPWWEAFREALYDEMGDPAEDAERHRAISPLFHADQIVKPMLVIQGANDPRVLQVESDELVAAARENGATVEYIVFPDEGHGFLKRENRITASEAYVEFLDTHLKGEAGDSEAASEAAE